jgi:molybdate transport system substrate-binding protein
MGTFPSRGRLAVLAAVTALAGCGGDDKPLVVFAASPLSGVAAEVDPAADVVAGESADLAARIRDGAEADVFLSSSEVALDELRADGAVEKPMALASDSLVIIVPAKNKADVTHIVDLTRKGVKLVLGADGVPVGDHARQSLELAGLGAALENVVGLENDSKTIVDKVASGEADAGIVYASDYEAAGSRVGAVPISEYFQPRIGYYAAMVSPGSDAAQRYLATLLGADGESALRVAGFRPSQ